MRITHGIDIVDISEITPTVQDPAQLQRMLHPGDIVRNDPIHIAGRITLKEATIKALGLKPGSWLDIRIHTLDSGKPIVNVIDPPQGLISMDGSVSHHGKMVIGSVVALFDDEDEQKIV